jgi:hypothetical protein
MADTGVTDRDQRARNYLEAARLLTRELDRAMLAISSNRLTDLEESLAVQEILTERLRGMRRQLWGRNDIRTPVALPAIDTDLTEVVAVADAELQGANRVYEAVLRHSSHSASLMASLLDSFKGHFQEASGPRLKYQTWSCQM